MSNDSGITEMNIIEAFNESYILFKDKMSRPECLGLNPNLKGIFMDIEFLLGSDVSNNHKDRKLFDKAIRSVDFEHIKNIKASPLKFFKMIDLDECSVKYSILESSGIMRKIKTFQNIDKDPIYTNIKPYLDKFVNRVYKIASVYHSKIKK